MRRIKILWKSSIKERRKNTRKGNLRLESRLQRLQVQPASQVQERTGCVFMPKKRQIRKRKGICSLQFAIRYRKVCRESRTLMSLVLKIWSPAAGRGLPQLLGLLLPGEQRAPGNTLKMETFIFLLNLSFVCANGYF